MSIISELGHRRSKICGVTEAEMKHKFLLSLPNFIAEPVYSGIVHAENVIRICLYSGGYDVATVKYTASYK